MSYKYNQCASFTEKQLTEETIRQQFDFSEDLFNKLQNALIELQISSLQWQARSQISKSTTPLSNDHNNQIECKPVIAALGGLLFKLKSLRGHEKWLLMKSSNEKNFLGPSPVEILKCLHEECILLVEAYQNDCDNNKIMKALANALHKHLKTFSKRVNFLIG